MASRKQIKERQKRILEFLSQGPVAKDHLCQLLDISPRTLASDLKELHNQNYEIKQKKNILYGINLTPSTTYEHSSLAIARQTAILLAMQENINNPITQEQLNTIYNNNVSLINPTGKGSNPDTFNNDIQTLIKEDYIGKNSDGTLYLTPKLSIIEKHSSESSQKMFRHLLNHSGGDGLDSVVNSIINKLGTNLYYKLYTDTDVPSAPYYTFKKKYPGDLSKSLSLFQNCDFYHQTLQIQYEPNGDTPRKFLFNTGKLIYSMEQSKLYALGSIQNKNNEKLELLNLEYITSVKSIDMTNPDYNAPKYQAICDEMFSISIEEPIHVKVFFKDELQIINKVKRLSATRPTSSLTPYQNGYIYQDTIRGFYDFARYLRGFGRSCKVIEPETLKENLVWSARKIFNEYQEIINKEIK